MPDFRLAYGPESDLADKIRSAIGAGAHEEVIAVLPQFQREAGDGPWFFPQSRTALDFVRGLPREVLQGLGLRFWEEMDGKELWLLPVEWADTLPDAVKVISIHGEQTTIGDVSDGGPADRRFGTLSVGLLLDPSEAPMVGTPHLDGTLVAAAVEKLPVDSILTSLRRFASSRQRSRTRS